MSKRQPHRKSRNGCQNCKEKHVKCDEQGPPCANCAVRDESCIYPRTRYRHRAVNARSHQELANTVTSITRSPSSLLSPSPSSSSHDLFDRSGILELELMHRWSVRVWEVFVFVPEEKELMQITVPQECLQHGFLRYNMFTAAALDAFASSVNSPRSKVYRQAALGYFNLCSESIRQELSANRVEFRPLLYLGAVVAAINYLAILQYILPENTGLVQLPIGGSVTHHALIFYEMCLGTSYVLGPHQALLEQALTYITPLRRYILSISLDELYEVDARGFALLTPVTEFFFSPENTKQTEENMSYSANTVLDRDTFNMTLSRLRLIYAQEVRGEIKAFCMTFAKYSGPVFASAVKKGDHLALLLFMYWGVLLHRLGRDYWWMGPLGQGVIAELSEALLPSPLSEIPGVIEAIQWTREQVDLETTICVKLVLGKQEQQATVGGNMS